MSYEQSGHYAWSQQAQSLDSLRQALAHQEVQAITAEGHDMKIQPYKRGATAAEDFALSHHGAPKRDRSSRSIPDVDLMNKFFHNNNVPVPYTLDQSLFSGLIQHRTKRVGLTKPERKDNNTLRYAVRLPRLQYGAHNINGEAITTIIGTKLPIFGTLIKTHDRRGNYVRLSNLAVLNQHLWQLRLNPKLNPSCASQILEHYRFYGYLDYVADQDASLHGEAPGEHVIATTILAGDAINVADLWVGCHPTLQNGCYAWLLLVQRHEKYETQEKMLHQHNKVLQAFLLTEGKTDTRSYWRFEPHVTFTKDVPPAYLYQGVGWRGAAVYVGQGRRTLPYSQEELLQHSAQVDSTIYTEDTSNEQHERLLQRLPNLPNLIVQ